MAQNIDELISLLQSRGNRNARELTPDEQLMQMMNQRKADYMYNQARSSSGGGDPYAGVVPMRTGDPMALVAERLGKIRGAMDFNMGSLMPGNASRVNADLRQQAGPLEDLMRSYEDKSGLERQLMEEQIRQLRLGGKADRRASSRNSALQKQAMRMQMQQQPQMRLVDPFKELREMAIKRGKKYLSIENPHLASSLDDY